MKKSILICIVLISLLAPITANFSFSQTAEELRQSISQREEEIKKLEELADAYKNEIDKTSSKAKTLNNEIAKINAEIKQLRNNIAITEKKLEATTLEIKELNHDIQSTESGVEKNIEYLSALLRELNDFSQKDFLIIFLEHKQISEIISKMAYFDALQANLIEKTNFLKSLKEDLKESLDDSEKKKEKFDNLARTLTAQKTVADDKKTEKSSVLTSTKNQEQVYQKLLSETVEKQKLIEKEIISLEQELRKQLNMSGLPSRTKGLFTYPVQNGYLTQEFGDVPPGSITRKYYSYHNGIDIGAKTGNGTPILSVMDGKIKAVGNNGKYAYGKWIAVDHGNGLTTLYAHLSLQSVSVGEKVKAGQIIGYMGATGLALGPHLHFTVYASSSFKTESRWYGLLPLGAPLNPNDYL